MNNFHKHVKSDKIKWIATGVALLLIALTVVGVCLQVFGKGKVKPSEWFTKTECVHIDEDEDGKCDKCKKAMPEDSGDADDETEGGGELTVKPEKQSALRLKSAPLRSAATVAAQSDAQTVSVTNPVEGYTYTWSLSGVSNPSEFIDLSATTGESVTVSAKKPFGTNITLKCEARLNDQVASDATCTLGYYKRVEKIYINLACNQQGAVLASGDFCSDGSTYSLDPWSAYNIAFVFSQSTFIFDSVSGPFNYTAGTDTRSDYPTTMQITETSSGKSFSVSLTSELSFYEFYYRYLCAYNNKAFVQSEYTSWKSGVSSAVGYAPAACNSLYYGTGGAAPLAGKTFNFSSAGITVSMTFPASAWAVPMSVSLNESNIIL